MDKTYRSEFQRLFLVEHLPEPMTRADAHLQLFDNYIENTRLRLRSIRVPETREWIRLLQQRFIVGADARQWKIAEIRLDDAEYHTLETFEGNEIRKNRHFYDLDGREVIIDLFLGTLWGLNLAKVCFETLTELEKFEPPPFAVLEVTNESFFRGENLVGKTFAGVQAAISEIAPKNE